MEISLLGSACPSVSTSGSQDSETFGSLASFHVATIVSFAVSSVVSLSLVAGAAGTVFGGDIPWRPMKPMPGRESGPASKFVLETSL